MRSTSILTCPGAPVGGAVHCKDIPAQVPHLNERPATDALMAYTAACKRLVATSKLWRLKVGR
jgi:hypothetical protein